MPKLTETQMQARLKQGAVSGLFLLHGNENYVKAHYAEQIKKKTVALDFETFNFQRFSGKQISMDEVNEAVESFPFMSESKCVVVQDLQVDALSDTDMQKLTQILEDVPPYCALVFLLLDVQLNKKTKKCGSFLSLCMEHGSVLEFNRKEGAELVQILLGGVKKRGCSMNRATAEYVITNVGNDLHLLLNEVEKLCAYAPGRELMRDDVDAVCTKSLEASVFDITRTLLRGQLGGALAILDVLRRQRAEPVMVHGAVVSSFVNMYRVRCAQAANLRSESVAAAFPGTSSYALRYAAQDAGKLPLNRLRICLEKLHEADRLLKGSAVDNWLALEQTLAWLSVILQEKKGK